MQVGSAQAAVRSILTFPKARIEKSSKPRRVGCLLLARLGCSVYEPERQTRLSGEDFSGPVIAGEERHHRSDGNDTRQTEGNPRSDYVATRILACGTGHRKSPGGIAWKLYQPTVSTAMIAPCSVKASGGKRASPVR
jgi:hypothetical protein